jgi:2-oxo-hept-3-ene-1,7-dioate hydratase
MLDAKTHHALALALHESERSGAQIEQFSKLHPGMDIADGYAIQREWVRLKVAEGRVVKGHKIGLTSRAMQISSQITEPDHGVLLDDMFCLMC